MIGIARALFRSQPAKPRAGTPGARLSFHLRRILATVMLVFALHTGAASGESAPALPDSPARGSEVGSGVATPPGHGRFWQRLTPYEPTYVLSEVDIGGDRGDNAKFQFSVAFQLVGDPSAQPTKGDDRAMGLYGAFTQTSLWDLAAPSQPFYDTSYRPEFFWHQGFSAGLLGTDGLGLEAGYAHESNGKAEPDSRSVNLLFIRPQLRWDLSDSWWLRVEPRFHAYIGDLSDNPAVATYRGYVNADVSVGNRDGVMLLVRGRLGSDGQYGSLQADLSYPLDQLSGGWIHGYAYLQSFTGWSESLLGYDQHVAQPRILIGLGLTR